MPASIIRVSKGDTAILGVQTIALMEKSIEHETTL